MTAETEKPKIAVLGSVNMDLVAKCARLPRPGETVSAASFSEIPGGKGANQAVSAARAGGDVQIIGRVGSDGFADQLRKNLESESIKCDRLSSTEGMPSGVALIGVEDSGENHIVVVPGANGCVSSDDVSDAEELIREADILLLQLEVPIETVLSAIEAARKAGTRVMVDPAPTPADPPAGLFDVDLICPNESEAAALTNLPVSSPEEIETAARKLASFGAKAVAITLGSQGAALLQGNEFSLIKAFDSNVVDTTAAGDAFAGALAVKWAESESLIDAVSFGNAAGAIAASRHGAQPGMALRNEIEQLIGGN